ncbi:MAG: hypothetical protein RIU71_715, partial [Pseudomonadota bacterium]
MLAAAERGKHAAGVARVGYFLAVGRRLAVAASPSVAPVDQPQCCRMQCGVAGFGFALGQSGLSICHGLGTQFVPAHGHWKCNCVAVMGHAQRAV